MPDVPPDARSAVERAHRDSWGRLLALLTGQLRSLDTAEEALADAFESALVHWPRTGVPDNPEAWLLTAARRRAIDLLRREAVLARKLPLLVTDEKQPPPDVAGPIPDERLRLLFTCCHPALDLQAQVALTLRCVAGLRTAEVARAFLVTEPTMAARVTRAKKKIAGAGIPYRVPSAAELPERLTGVLAVLYLVFTEGYSATSGESAIRWELCAEAIRLNRVVHTLMPGEPEVAGLLALMLIQHSRRDARLDAAGRIVLLPDQDRSRWYHDEIAEALYLLAGTGPARGQYALQAAIAAEHAVAPSAERTAWPRIATLYATLEDLTGSPVVRLNRAVALAEADGPEAGLALLTGLDEVLPRLHLVPAARADMLRRLGRAEQARGEYRRALALVGNDAERAFLQERLDAL